MSFRKVASIALVSLTFAGAVFAQVSASLAEWGKGPAQSFMTKDELDAWKKAKSDAEAQAVVDLFWARRDPSPGTARNEFREEFEARMKLADEKFSSKKSKGSLTEFGKLIAIVGPPTKIQSTGRQGGVAEPGGTSNQNAMEGIPQQRWIYEGANVPKFAGVNKLEFTFFDQLHTGNFKLDNASTRKLNELSAKASTAALVSPNLTAADLQKQAAGKQVVEVAIPAPVIKDATTTTATTFKNAGLGAAVSAFKGEKTSPYKNVYVSWAEGVTATGEYFVPVQLYVTKDAGIAADAEYVFFGQVEDATGNVVAVYEEPARLVASKNDFYVDRSLVLPSGKYTGYFGLATADGKPVTIAKSDMTLSSIDKTSPGTSKLILSNNVYTLAKAQAPTDPFAFAGIKVVPKGDRMFTQEDELAYFIEIRNPGLDENGKPRFQLSIEMTDATGKKKGNPLAEVEVAPLPGVEGHYFVGSGYPLQTFAPGKYKMKLKLIDMVSKQTYNFEDNFTIVGKK